MDHEKLGPQFHQLTMFHTAEELRGGGVGKFLPGDLDDEIEEWGEADDDEPTYRPETEEEGWERKADEADAMGLTQHIGWHGGVERPVDLSVGDALIGREKGTIMNGHHRIAAQHDINPKALLPVTWTSRLHAGSGNRSHFPGHVPEDKGKENWSSEDEQDIGYEKRW